ncbi:hypothetical protein G9A89_016710 [Geosiphon pyriformis]|nr:hypothetical protein G9A89_016710 [Geosiphon pyriformis]
MSQPGPPQSTSTQQHHQQERSPTDFLNNVIGRPVVVKLNSGVDYRGILSCLDGYMNIALEQTEEWVNGQLKNKYGDAFIRGNNARIRGEINNAFRTGNERITSKYNFSLKRFIEIPQYLFTSIQNFNYTYRRLKHLEISQSSFDVTPSIGESPDNLDGKNIYFCVFFFDIRDSQNGQAIKFPGGSPGHNCVPLMKLPLKLSLSFRKYEHPSSAKTSLWKVCIPLKKWQAPNRSDYGKGICEKDEGETINPAKVCTVTAAEIIRAHIGNQCFLEVLGRGLPISAFLVVRTTSCERGVKTNHPYNILKAVIHPTYKFHSTVVSIGPTEKSKLDEKRLYIGNLDPAIDEYTVIKLFEAYGKITHLDYLFHKSGPRRGQPRGYCFLEYSRKEEALKAMTTMHSKVIKHRAIIVTYAYAAPDNYENGSSSNFKKRVGSFMNNRPTTISLLKAHKMVNASTDSKIQTLERKLAQMQQQQHQTVASDLSPKKMRQSRDSESLLTNSQTIPKKENSLPSFQSINTANLKHANISTQQRFNPYEIPKHKK